MAFFILVIAIAGGIFWFNRKSAIDKYTKKQELAMKILEKSKRIACAQDCESAEYLHRHHL